MFGNVNNELIDNLEFALEGVRGERGHDLEPVHNNPQLVKAEEHIATAIRLLEVYRLFVAKGGN